MAARRGVSCRVPTLLLVLSVLGALLATAAPAPASVAAASAPPAEQPAILFSADGCGPTWSTGSRPEGPCRTCAS